MIWGKGFYFQDRYGVAVLPVPSFETKFPVIEIKEIFDLMKHRTSLGDALMISVAKKTFVLRYDNDFLG
jgi:hypothetical protein